MKANFLKRLLVSGLLVVLPLLGMAQAHCTRYDIPSGPFFGGATIVIMDCDNGEGIWWIE